MLSACNGFRIIEDESLVIRGQVKFPRSKKKRIQKKWRGNVANWLPRPDLNYYINHKFGIISCHPVAAKALKAYAEPIDRNYFQNNYLGVW